jgi:thymidylate kinase
MLRVDIKITGPQGGGKTTTARRLRAWFQNRDPRLAVRLEDGDNIEGPINASVFIHTVQE